MEIPSRGTRLGAVLIDSLLFVVPIGIGRIFSDPGPLIALLGLLGLFGYQAYLLTKQGQTIGKRALKLRIVRADDGENGGFGRNVALRMILGRWLLGLVPFYLLVDACFIFRSDGRCLHDLVAGTRVIPAEEAPPA